jgi:hypothetical protein
MLTCLYSFRILFEKSKEIGAGMPTLYSDDYNTINYGGIYHMSAELKQKLQNLKDRILALQEHL